MAANDIGPRIGIDGEKEFRDSINAINAQMKALGAEMKAVTAEFAANSNSEEALAAKNEVLGKSVQAAKNKMTVLDSQLERQRSKLAELGAELDRVIATEGENSAAAVKAQNAYNQQTRSVANLERQYQTARGQLAGFQNAMDGVEDSSTRAEQALSAQSVLAGMGAWSALEGAVRSAAAAIEDSIQVGMAFDAEISNLAATMGKTVDEIGNLRDFAKGMGAETEFTASQATQGLNYLALAGKNAVESMEMLPLTLDLASAGGLELATSTDMITDAQSALTLTTAQTNQLIDEMAKASTQANQSVGGFGAGLLEVGGTAKIMSGGTAEINQVLGILADNSIKGAEGGTKLRNVILALSAPTDKAAAQLEKLRVKIFDTEGDMRSFSDIFQEMNQSLSSLTKQERITALSNIFNDRDIAAAEALLGTTVERWDELAVAIDNAAGSAEKMAETRLDNLAGDITLLQSAADGARIAFSDSLTPALRDVTQAGTGILTFVGDAITEFPILGNVVAGAVTGVGALTVGMGAMAAASTLGVTSIGALTTAILASPVAPFALGIGAVTTAITTFSAAADKGKTANEEFLESLEETKNRLSENAAAAEGSADELRAQADALLLLADAGELTSAQQQALLGMIQELNAQVPGLNLAYDEQTGKLNMTAEAVRNLIEAEAQRMVANEGAQAYKDLLVQQMEVANQLTDAEIALEEARAKNAAAQKEIVVNGQKVVQLDSELAKAQSEAAQAVADLKTQYDALQQALDEVLVKYGDAASGADNVATSTDNLSDSIEDAEDSANEAVLSLEELEEATLNAAGAADTMSAALKEQEKDGSLSLETTNKLIEAGYAAAIAIDQETGAVTLDQGAYVALASAKIQEQIATLESSKANLESKKALDEASNAAARTGSAYWDAAKGALALKYAEDKKPIDLQIAALKRAMDALNSYGTATTTVARSSASASKTVKTQAQKDLEEYKTLKAALDHEKAMDLVDEADYYNQLAGLRDKYLTDAANLSDYRKVSETIYKAEKASIEEMRVANEKAIKEQQKAEKAALEELEKQWETAGKNIIKLEEDFQKELSSRASEIVNSYKLFEEVPKQQQVSGAKLIKNLQGQINSLEQFYSNLDELASRGVSENLVDEIRNMGVSASGELNALLKLSDKDLTKYSDLYKEKQELANEQAKKELEALREVTNEEILGQLEDVAALYDTNAPALGLAFANSLAEGMLEGMGAVESMAEAIGSAALSAFEKTYNGDVEAMMTAPKQTVTMEDIGELLAGAVSGINMGGGGGMAQPMNITIQTRDGIEIARAFLPDIRTAEKETPQTLDDT